MKAESHRWWLVDLKRGQALGHFLYLAPGRRQALASFSRPE